MKRTLLDITNGISRNLATVILTPYNLDDSIHSIWIARGWRFVEILREMGIRPEQDRIKLFINTQHINPRDFLIETGTDGIIIKFIKFRFEYQLDRLDEILIIGDIEKYA
jgi:hypothetical protein